MLLLLHLKDATYAGHLSTLQGLQRHIEAHLMLLRDGLSHLWPS